LDDFPDIFHDGLGRLLHQGRSARKPNFRGLINRVIDEAEPLTSASYSLARIRSISSFSGDSREVMPKREVMRFLSLERANLPNFWSQH
jgi:hypothetical protein